MSSLLQDTPLSRLALGALLLFLFYKIHHSFALWASRRKIIKQYGCLPPPSYHHIDPILGLDFAIENARSAKSKTFLETTRNRFLKYGNTYSLNAIGNKVITTCEPENVKTVLALNFRDYNLRAMRKKGFAPLLGKGIFTNDGSAWEHSRAMLRPNFSRQQVSNLATYEEHVQNVINAVPKDGSTVDLQDLFFEMTLDTATEFLFGESANALPNRNNMAPGEISFSEAFTYCTTAIGDQLRFNIVYPFQSKSYNRYRETIYSFTDYYVQKAIDRYHANKAGATMYSDDNKSNSGNRYVFLDELVKQTQDPITLRSECMNILLAGRDTTASLLGNLWDTLSKRPDIWAKVLSEVDQLDGARPSFETMKSMKYLRYCINESLRMYPVVFANSRDAVCDTVLPCGGGPDGKAPVFVPKGAVVAYSPYAMHRREDFFGPDASEFRPERWEKLRPGWEYLPFNGGPRICLGQQLALTEASYTTIRLMQRFRNIEPRDSNPWREGLTITCASGHGAKVSLT